MKMLKRLFQRIRIASNEAADTRLMPFLKNKLGLLAFQNKLSSFRLIAPIQKPNDLRLPSNNAQQDLPRIGGGLTNLQDIDGKSGTQLSLYQASLTEQKYALLFKGAPPSSLRAIEKWSDLPILVPIAESLTKIYGDLLSPLQKITLPSLLSGESHLVQSEADQATRLLFLIPIFLHLLQMDFPVRQDEIIQDTGANGVAATAAATMLAGSVAPVRVLILAKDQEQIEAVTQDMNQLQGVFKEGFSGAASLQKSIVIDTPKNLLENLRSKKISADEVKILVVNDMAAMEDLGYAKDIVAVNEMIGTGKQVIVITEEVRSNSLVMDQMMTNFKFYAFVLTQYATAILKEYALKASMWTILLLLATVAYLASQINKQKETPATPATAAAAQAKK